MYISQLIITFTTNQHRT